MNAQNLGFEMRKLSIPLSALFPVRQVKDLKRDITRYKTIVASIKEIGLVEPLMVYPQKGKAKTYLIMDGHLRYFALKELGHKEADCLIALENESFTFNARINRLAPIQEHKMISRAVQNGVPPERVAAALNLSLKTVEAFLTLLNGIHEDAANMLKDKPISPASIQRLKRVTPLRQIEIAELMLSMNNFTAGYTEALIMATHKNQLVQTKKHKCKRGLTIEETVRLQHEMASLEQDFKAAEKTYGEDVLNLSVARSYLKKLLDNTRVVKFLRSRYPDLYTEFEAIVAAETLHLVS